MNLGGQFETRTNTKVNELKFIDLFSGIGGFHIAFHNLKSKCVFASEIDAEARKTYSENFKYINPDLFKSEHTFNRDITNVNIENIPDFDILCAGFPCQPFSNAGFKKGFSDTRGTLFFNIVDFISKKNPRAFFLENVRGLLTHDGGRTFSVIKKTMEQLGYSFYYKIIKASDFGLPQYRPRLYMVGFKDKSIKFDFPQGKPLQYTMSDILGGECSKVIGYTLRVGGRKSGIGDRRNWDCYMVKDREIQLKPEHGLKMQGFPEDFKLPVSETQAMKQLGNSVAVTVIQAIGESIIKALG